MRLSLHHGYIHLAISVNLSGGGTPKEGISKLAKTAEASGLEKKLIYSLKDGKCSGSGAYIGVFESYNSHGTD